MNFGSKYSVPNFPLPMFILTGWKIVDFPNSINYDLQGGLISEKYYISKKILKSLSN